jgi:hypothetical protein
LARKRSGISFGRVDVTRPFTEWPDAEAITGRLIGNSARLVETPVDG